MIFTCVLFRYNITKVLRFFTGKVDLKEQFCKNGGNGVLLQPLII